MKYPGLQEEVLVSISIVLNHPGGGRQENLSSSDNTWQQDVKLGGSDAPTQEK